MGEHIATRGLGHAGVPDILRELASFGIAAVVHDPLADPAGAAGEYGIELGRLDCGMVSMPWCWRCRTGSIGSWAKPASPPPGPGGI